VREVLSFTPDEQILWLKQSSSQEVVLLVTCNRVELYAYLPDAQMVDALWLNLLYQKGIDPTRLAPYTTRLQGYEAAHHLFQVTSSLKSLALGEAQILGQVTTAFEQAQHSGTCGQYVSMIFRAAIHAAKRVQHETVLGQGQVSVSSLGIHKIEQVLGDLKQRSILVIGAGEMGQAVIKGLDRREAQNVTLLSRTYDHARQVADAWRVKVRPITDLKDMLVQAEIVFTTSSAPFPILTTADLLPIMELRGNRPLYIVDIAVPRDVEAIVAQIPGISLYDLDELEQVTQANHQERRRAVPHAECILDEELGKLWHNYEGQSVVPMIRQLRKHVDQIRQAELERIANRLPHENVEEIRNLLEEFSQRFMNKVLHHPTLNLKAKASQGTGNLFSSLTRDLFGLEELP
jgi:glutamyl-tRNA reductase